MNINSHFLSSSSLFFVEVFPLLSFFKYFLYFIIFEEGPRTATLKNMKRTPTSMQGSRVEQPCYDGASSRAQRSIIAAAIRLVAVNLNHPNGAMSAVTLFALNETEAICYMHVIWSSPVPACPYKSRSIFYHFSFNFICFNFWAGISPFSKYLRSIFMRLSVQGQIQICSI